MLNAQIGAAPLSIAVNVSVQSTAVRLQVQRAMCASLGRDQPIGWERPRSKRSISTRSLISRRLTSRNE